MGTLVKMLPVLKVFLRNWQETYLRTIVGSTRSRPFAGIAGSRRKTLRSSLLEWTAYAELTGRATAKLDLTTNGEPLSAGGNRARHASAE